MLKKKKTDYFITFIAEFFVLISGILVYKFANQNLGESGFSLYALIRRFISLLHPVLFIGLAVAIPRYIAFSNAEANPVKSNTYFITGLMIITILTSLSLLILFIFKEQAAFFIFGSMNYEYMIFPIILMLSGLVLHSAFYSYYRGNEMMLKANILQIINLGIVPIFCLLYSKDIKTVLVLSGILWIIFSMIIFLEILLRIKWDNTKIKQCGKELIVYGIQRIPGDIALALFFAAPAFFIVHIKDVTTGGFMAFGSTLITMVGAAFSPLSLMLLPQTSKLIAAKDYKKLKIITFKIFKWTIFFTLLGVLIFEVFASQILNLYFSKADNQLVIICQLVITSSIGYTVYISLRSILDAYYIKAVNTINIFISFIIFIIISGILFINFNNFYTIVIGFSLSMIILGILTYHRTIKMIKLNL